MAITGEVGTGKTTLCRTLLRRLGSDTEVAFLFNPTLTPLELLKAINGEFGLSTFGDSRPELTDVLNAFLLEQRSEGRRVLLIIDEAQNLATETLEQLRLLSNLETETSKLLQIVLLGQPELDAEARGPGAAPAAPAHQRVVPARTDERRGDRRVRAPPPARRGRAGAADLHRRGAARGPPASAAACRALINLLCDRALLAGYADQKAQIGRRLDRARRARDAPPSGAVAGRTSTLGARRARRSARRGGRAARGGAVRGGRQRAASRRGRAARARAAAAGRRRSSGARRRRRAESAAASRRRRRRVHRRRRSARMLPLRTSRARTAPPRSTPRSRVWGLPARGRAASSSSTSCASSSRASASS